MRNAPCSVEVVAEDLLRRTGYDYLSLDMPYRDRVVSYRKEQLQFFVESRSMWI